MNKVSFNLEHKVFLDSHLLPIPNVHAGKMFGYPAYYVGKKLFACVYEEGVGIKLPAEIVSSILDGNTYVPFQPMGRHIMREWVQICRNISSEYQSDINLFTASIEFVSRKNGL